VSGEEEKLPGGFVTFGKKMVLAIFAKRDKMPTGDTSMPTRNINLTEHFDHFVERQVSSGRYSNASEIVREALRLLEEREQERAAKLKSLRQAAKQGFDELDQGKGIVLKDKKAINQFITEIEAEVRTIAVKNGG
jgi:antitoxin ParD1/3/4